MTTRYTLSRALPQTFEARDILAFHGRDTQQIAERVSASHLQKGLVWNARPAALSIRFGRGRAQARLCIEASPRDHDHPAIEAMVCRMLGLSQEIDAFEAHYRDHPQLGRLIAARPGLRVPMTATPFEALTWAITGQQISVQAAVALRRRLILLAGVRHSEGLLCYPAEQQVAELPEERLRQAGFSAVKARTLREVARLARDGALPLAAWAQDFPGADVIRERLEAVRGIGPWTVNYALLRGFGWLDGSLHGDAAVRRGLQGLLGISDNVDAEQAKVWLAQFSPWRALVGAHLWAVQGKAE